MNKRCEPGDIAVIVGVFNEANRSTIGQLVEVIEGDGAGWIVAAIGFRFPETTFESLFSDGERTAILDEHLKPLRGNPDEQTETDVEAAA